MADDLDRLQRRQEVAATVALERTMELIVGEAARIAPHDEGELSASGDVEIDRRHDGVEVVGSFNKVYAEVQHEDLSLTHKPGRRAKYLEEPFNRAAGKADRIVAAAVRRVT